MTAASHIHEAYMHQALALAEQAEAIGEVPVGALVVLDDTVIGRGFNQVITQKDPSAHAEMLALREAAQHIGNYRILDATLYVTLEPCAMCSGALVHSRLARVVYGAADPKTGACGSVMNLAQHSAMNHQLEVIGGVLGTPCGERLSAFFRQRRAAQKALKRAAQNYSSS